MPDKLREGFTTGSAAAAAAYAAVALLLGGERPGSVSVALPPFVPGAGGWEPERGERLNITIEGGALLPDGGAWALVIKDGGDDPDATHGARLVVTAFLNAPEAEGLVPAPPLSAHTDLVFLYGGRGVGRVTLPGLPVAVGEAAVNPEPRRQIAFAATEAALKFGHAGPLHLVISVPDGEKRAARTLNARLGIVGGISILGTRGTVRPYSHEAWIATIGQALSVAAALGIQELLLATGRRSERLGFALYPQLPPQAGVQVADFAAFALRGAAGHSFSRLIWLCFPGKLLKLAQGLEWTHAKSAAADINLLARYCREAGGSAALAESVAAMPTATGAFVLMAEEGQVHDQVLRRLGKQALGVMRGWLDAAGREPGRPELRLHVFSLEKRLLLTLPG